MFSLDASCIAFSGVKSGMLRWRDVLDNRGEAVQAPTHLVVNLLQAVGAAAGNLWSLESPE